MSDWIYGIVAVMMFGTVILQVTPEGTYQKYVRLFLGAMLMLTVTRPLFSWFDLSEKTRLSFEQGMLSSWIGAPSFGSTGNERVWQDADRWELQLQEQVDRKQETWVKQVLESTAREYGFLYLDHEVRWNEAGNWPEKLILWVKKWEEGETCASEDVSGVETELLMEITGISTVTPILSVVDGTILANGDTESEIYYEPSELRPLHEALQVVWQLEDGQIVVYWQR